MNKLAKQVDNLLLDNKLSVGEIISIDEAIRKKQELFNQLKENFDEEVVRKYLDQVFSYQVSLNLENIVVNPKQKIKVPKSYQKLEEHFQKLATCPQPDQRTPEWYDFRHGRITASDIATALDHNPYEPWEEFIIKKTTPNYPFYDHDIVFHGKKHEEVATKIYQEIFNVKVDEFGCLPHPKYKFLGASPDGICSKETLDGKFSERLGVMLEIKCPITREIYHSGEIKGHICPHYYWYQCQVQLECCELEQCDFWQCDIQEISLEEYKKGIFETNYTQGIEGSPLQVPETCRQGVILQYLKKNYKPRYVNEEFNGKKFTDKIEYQGKIVYPDRMNYNYLQYQEWILETMEKNKSNPEFNDYYFDKVIYWRLKGCHNVAVMRDREWFAKHLPILEDTWNQVIYYRQHLDELDEFRTISKKKRDFWRYKPIIDIKSKELSNLLFLNDNKKETKETNTINQDDFDFVD